MLKNGFQNCEQFGSEGGRQGRTLCILESTSASDKSFKTLKY